MRAAKSSKGCICRSFGASTAILLLILLATTIFKASCNDDSSPPRHSIRHHYRTKLRRNGGASVNQKSFYPHRSHYFKNGSEDLSNYVQSYKPRYVKHRLPQPLQHYQQQQRYRLPQSDETRKCSLRCVLVYEPRVSQQLSSQIQSPCANADTSSRFESSKMPQYRYPPERRPPIRWPGRKRPSECFARGFLTPVFCTRITLISFSIVVPINKLRALK